MTTSSTPSARIGRLTNRERTTPGSTRRVLTSPLGTTVVTWWAKTWWAKTSRYGANAMMCGFDAFRDAFLLCFALIQREAEKKHPTAVVQGGGTAADCVSAVRRSQ